MPLPWEVGPEAVAWTHPAAIDEEKLLAQCRFGQSRTGGPGGQNRNKVETAVVLVHEPTGLSAQAGERRHMGENKSLALFRLRLTLATHHRGAVGIGPVGTERWRARLRRPKRRPSADPLAPRAASATIEINPSHKDYPALLAEAIDVLEAANYDLKTAALRLDVSASQLIKLIKHHPPALHAVNEARAKRGMHTLK
ncbi:MAG: peptide chain release factor-like protein [Planctomycetota bacterium]